MRGHYILLSGCKITKKSAITSNLCRLFRVMIFLLIFAGQMLNSGNSLSDADLRREAKARFTGAAVELTAVGVLLSPYIPEGDIRTCARGKHGVYQTYADYSQGISGEQVSRRQLHRIHFP